MRSRYLFRGLVPPALSLICFGPWVGTAAETVFLKDGRKVSGHIVSQDRNSVRIRVAGSVRLISKATVARILYDGSAKGGPGTAGGPKRAATDRTKPKKVPTKEERAKPASEAANQGPQRMGDNAWPIAPGLWRSLLLPGWGQLHQGRELAGYAWSSGFLLVALACGRQLHTAASQKDSYQKGSAAAVLLSPGLVSVLQKGTAIDAQSSGIQLLLLSAGNGSARQGQHMQAARGKRLVGALAALYTIAAIDTVVFRPDSRTAMSAGLSTDSLSFRISVSF